MECFMNLHASTGATLIFSVLFLLWYVAANVSTGLSKYPAIEREVPIGQVLTHKVEPHITNFCFILNTQVLSR